MAKFGFNPSGYGSRAAQSPRAVQAAGTPAPSGVTSDTRLSDAAAEALLRREALTPAELTALANWRARTMRELTAARSLLTAVGERLRAALKADDKLRSVLGLRINVMMFRKYPVVEALAVLARWGVESDPELPLYLEPTSIRDRLKAVSSKDREAILAELREIEGVAVREYPQLMAVKRLGAK
jgi:hypothetical protein